MAAYMTISNCIPITQSVTNHLYSIFLNHLTTTLLLFLNILQLNYGRSTAYGIVHWSMLLPTHEETLQSSFQFIFRWLKTFHSFRLLLFVAFLTEWKGLLHSRVIGSTENKDSLLVVNKFHWINRFYRSLAMTYFPHHSFRREAYSAWAVLGLT